jgi:predicted TPR repeat methyltransferase
MFAYDMQATRRATIVGEATKGGVLAYGYSSEKDAPILFAIMKKIAEYFPDSSTARELSAQVYWTAGKKDVALSQFKRALELDPENRNAAKMIRLLENGRKY